MHADFHKRFSLPPFPRKHLGLALELLGLEVGQQGHGHLVLGQGPDSGESPGKLLACNAVVEASKNGGWPASATRLLGLQTERDGADLTCMQHDAGSFSHPSRTSGGGLTAKQKPLFFDSFRCPCTE